MKKCPFCAEEIQDEAVKCRYCGEFLDCKPPEISKVELPLGIQLDDAPVPAPPAAKRMTPALGCLGCGGVSLVCALALSLPPEHPTKASPPASTATAQVFKESPEYIAQRQAAEKKEKADLEKMRKQLAREKVDREKRLKAEKVQQEQAKHLAVERAAKTYHNSFFLRSYDSSAEEYSWSIFGEIENITSRRFNYVQVEISLLDDAGNLVGSSMANVNNLEPGQVWKFRTQETEDRATKFRIKDITGF